MIEKTCITCHKDFKTYKSNAERGWGRFCSRSCSAKSGLTSFNALRSLEAYRRREIQHQPDTHKLIGLGSGKVALVSNEDFSELDTWLWGLQGNGYAARNDDRKTMHRVVFEYILRRPLSLGEYVDHINHDRLDNRRDNLRVATIQQNSFNSKPRAGSASVFKGVYWNKNNSNWNASITYDRQYIHLGVFADELDAAIAYDQAAIQLVGEFAFLNVL